ncbi:hypothetical protein J2S43_008102 [Catenuloplanes nepalensis]|uniref:Lipoprotein n=1 Tax=Catenuloplanes nepalensis TaxID=587533 RepID=A0ABT9N7V3_9ACTN|nr:hypothetical protein [Catenuloplanes nepalensis]MDP9799590.1 hypothetical protein [Catenuloplanes nepalensis]
MRRLPYLGILLVLPLAACAAPGGTPSAGAPSGTAPEAFTSRAEAVAASWPAVEAAAPAWRTGFVPLQDLLIAPAGLTDGQRQAFDAGWFTLEGSLPSAAASGEVAYAAGAEKTPLLSAADTFALIDQGDPPPCEPATGGRAPSAGTKPGPDSPVSAADDAVCTKLPVTGATLGTVPLRTSRGDATVPAWLFSVRGVSSPVARVAVTPASTAPVPSPSLAPPGAGGTDLKATQSLARVAGTTLDLRLGVGACDEQITPLVHETDTLIIVGGTATSTAEMCTEQLVIHPASATLAAPAGDRPILDALTGQLLILKP